MFDHVFYSMHYNDIKGSKHMLLYHYKNIQQKRFQNFNELCKDSFDIEYFKKEHRDVDLHTLEECIKYYLSSIKINLKKYIFFSNAVYRFYNPYAHVIYKNIYNNDLVNISKYICSIHCYDLNNFEVMFMEIMNGMKNHFSFIVTFVKINEDIVKKYSNIIFICTPNKGFDLINKFTVSCFLKQHSVDYKYICFFHSKNCKERRKAYMNFLLYNYDNIIKSMDSENEYGGLFPNLIRIGDPQTNLSSYRKRYEISWGANKYHVVDLCKYLNIDENRYIFVEGNSYVLHKNIVEKIFTDIKLYNSLNHNSTVDLSWVKASYNLHDTNYDKVFEKYHCHELAGNLFAVNSINSRKIKKPHRDFMFEHAFERVILNLVVNSGMDFNIYSLAYGINNKFDESYFNKLKNIIIENEYGNKKLYFNKKFYLKKYNYLNFKDNHDMFYYFINNGIYQGHVYNQYQTK